MAKQRISYFDPAMMTDPAMLEELDRCRREGTPRPEVPQSVLMCRPAFGPSRILGAIFSRTVSAITVSKNSAASMFHDRSTASTAATNVPSKRPRRVLKRRNMMTC